MPLKEGEEGGCFSFVPDFLEAKTAYTVKVKVMVQGKESKWGEEAVFMAISSECCAWKKCPDYVKEDRKYSVNEKNPRVATKTNGWCCTIIESTPLPLNKVTSWSIKIMKSKDSDGGIWDLYWSCSF